MDGVQALREKYEEIKRLRLLHASPDEPDPAAALRALAARFPGALREIDVLTMDEIDRRLRALDAGVEEPWMRAQIVFHDELRGALVVKRWLGKRRVVDAEVTASFDAEVEDASARSWRPDLAQLARPPRGRILDLVLARVAARCGVGEDEARKLVL